jgi:hypothetical protein
LPPVFAAELKVTAQTARQFRSRNFCSAINVSSRARERCCAQQQRGCAKFCGIKQCAP